MAHVRSYHLLLTGAVGLFLARTTAGVTTGRAGHGLIGYGIQMFQPPCAYACRDTVSSWPLDCPGADMSGMDMDGMGMSQPDPECLATNDAYLQTLAWCMSTHCIGIDPATLEGYWQLNVAGRQDVQPSPKESYQQALAKVTFPPTTVINSSDTLNVTSLVDEKSYVANYNADANFELMEITQEQYGLVLLVSCSVIPIVASLVRFLPLPEPLVSKFYASVVESPLFGRHHSVPVLGLVFVPTRGQALFIAYILIANVVLCAIGYQAAQPNAWYSSSSLEIMTYVANRFGVLSFANLPLLILYAGRNNALLWLTSWSHSTFLLLHRWVAAVCMLQAALHSAIYLQIYVTGDSHEYASESQLAYWIWGIIATLCLVLLMPLSTLRIRQRLYEIFLASHVALSLLSLIGCFLHIYYRFQTQWGYETWIYVASAIWGFDRLLARPVRLARNGLRRAYVSAVDKDYLRVDIHGLKCAGHVYLYFPTLTWRVWENHPFSVAAGGCQIVQGSSQTGNVHSPLTYASGKDETHTEITSAASSTGFPVYGTTFFIRKGGGLTRSLGSFAKSGAGIPVLIESSYGTAHTSLTAESWRPSPTYPNLVFIAGGVGITALLPMLNESQTLLAPIGTTKLYWGVRSRGLVTAVESLMGRGKEMEDGQERWGSINLQLSIGDRFDFETILDKELRASESGTTVVVSGPPGMADEVRCIVMGLKKGGVMLRYMEESFSW